MRNGFRTIVEGWTLIDSLEELTGRIERAGYWATENGPLTPLEATTIEMMILCEVARGWEGAPLAQFLAGLGFV